MTGFSVRGWFECCVAVLTILAGLLLAWLLVGRKASQSPRRQLPPGPKGWPLLGSIPSLGTLPHQTLIELSKQYGPLMLMHLGSVRCIVVTSPFFAEMVLKTYDKVMASRPFHIVARNITYNASDVAWSPLGQRWRNLRKICTLGLLTANRIAQFRGIRQREVLDSLHFILEESKRGNAVNMAECFANITLNNMSQMTMSQSLSVQKSGSSSSSSSVLPEKSRWFAELLRELFEMMGAFNIADYVPVLKPIDPQGFYKRSDAMHRSLDKIIEKIIFERRQRASIEKAENRREDFLDALLGFEQTTEFEGRLSMDEVKGSLLDMLAAGTDASATSMNWALTRILSQPSLLRRLQAELDSVVGPHRLVQEEDLPKLQCLHAVVKETYRLHPAAPLLVPHESTEDCEIGGFHIPAKTRIFINVYGIHRDPAVWERPLEFDPDRFLNSTRDFRGLNFELLPFGSGRRICPGLNLGQLLVTYALALMLHAVDWALPEGQKPEEMDLAETFGLNIYKAIPLKVFGKARLAHDVIYPPL